MEKSVQFWMDSGRNLSTCRQTGVAGANGHKLNPSSESSHIAVSNTSVHPEDAMDDHVLDVRPLPKIDLVLTNHQSSAVGLHHRHVFLGQDESNFGVFILVVKSGV
jgi:hypothetical protein